MIRIGHKGLNVQADDSEQTLLEQLRSGSESAAEQMVREHIGWMRGLALRIVSDGDTADDVVQDAFINAFRHIDKFKGNASLKTWLHRIVVNTALMRLRKTKRLKEQSIDDLQTEYAPQGHRLNPPTSLSATPGEILEQADLRASVLMAISQLPEAYRIVLQLRDIEELSTSEVASALQISEANVKVRLHRGRTALKTLLEPVFKDGL